MLNVSLTKIKQDNYRVLSFNSQSYVKMKKMSEGFS